MTLRLGPIADWIHAEGDFEPRAEAAGYSIDSRTLGAGDLFFAVRGDRVDGHDYVEAALANGAVAAVVSMRWLRPATVQESKLLRVPDEASDCVLQSLQRLAHEVRRTWGKRVIGVTGSAGKTTTKECIAAVLGAQFCVLKTEGNLNNHFGVPLQLLRLQPQHDVAVLEMGMNHAGEIRALARIAEPDWGVVSNVGPVHLEFFADGIEGIARAKYELIESLPEDGLRVLNADDERVASFARGRTAHTILYGTSERAQVRATDLEELGVEGTRFTIAVGDEQRRVHLHLPGRHNVLNALAAVACGVSSGMRLQTCCEALEQMSPSAKRGRVLHWNGATLIDDTYNSNPKALESMLETLRRTPASRRYVVAGEMLELGAEGETLHRKAGESMKGIDAVLGVRGLAASLVQGARNAGVRAEFVSTPEEAGAWLQMLLQPGDVVLLKGSRGVQLERALEPFSAPRRPAYHKE